VAIKLMCKCGAHNTIVLDFIKREVYTVCQKCRALDPA
jgi:hypothetical protein